MLLVKKQQGQHEKNDEHSSHKQAHNGSIVCPRSVVTFYHGTGDESLPKIREEVDLADLEVLVETYKFLVANHRKNMSSGLNQRKLKNRRFRSGNGSTSGTQSNMVVSELHKQAIMTLVQVDRRTKRVVAIRPEFFPISSRVLPLCISRLDGLRRLRLDHCKDLTSFPVGFSLSALEELQIDVSSFQEPFPKSFGRLINLRRLILHGECAGLGEARHDKMTSNSKEETLLFPEAMAGLTQLKYLKTHIQNLLHIPSCVMESWSSILEELVVTHDLTSSSSANGSNSESLKRTDSSRQRKKARKFSGIGGGYGYSSESSFSSDDDFNFLDSADEVSSDDDEGDDLGFSLLKNRGLFREALRNQLEARAFSSISSFTNLRSLKLVFDDSKYRSNIQSARDRFRNKNRKHEMGPYNVPLSVLANGPLSRTLKELDIGTYIASTSSSASRKKSKIPIQISWMDVLQQFPLLEKLRLQDCKCTFLDDLSKADEEDDDTLFLLPHLKHLVLDRCPDFALVNATSTSPRFSSCDLEMVPDDHRDHSESRSEEEDDNLGPSQLKGDDEDNHPNEFFEPLNDIEMDTLVDEHTEEIARIIRLTSLLADTVLKESLTDEDAESELYDTKKLSILCKQLLVRCPKLERLSLRDCGIVGFSSDLFTCLPRDSFLELTLDSLYEDDDSDNLVQNNLWTLFDAFPSLMQLQGTYMNGLVKHEADKLQRRLMQRQHKYRAKQERERELAIQQQKDQTSLSQSRWKIFFDHSQHGKSSHVAADDPADVSVRPSNKENNNPVAAVVNILERRFFKPRVSDRDNSRQSTNTSVLRNIKRSNSRDML